MSAPILEHTSLSGERDSRGIRILESVGNTPLLELERISAEVTPVRILGKASEDWDGGYVFMGLIGNGDAFACRDPAGIRPGFYYINDEVVAAASERAALANSIKEGGIQLEYEDEDPRVHKIFEEELAKHGQECRMKNLVSTPVRDFVLTPGAHRLVVEHSHFETFDEQITIGFGERQIRHIVLEQGRGTLSTCTPFTTFGHHSGNSQMSSG